MLGTRAVKVAEALRVRLVKTSVAKIPSIARSSATPSETRDSLVASSSPPNDAVTLGYEGFNFA